MPQAFTFADVAKHNSKEDIYIVLYDSVYDVSTFIDEHPGGEEVLLEVGGQDATEAYEDAGHSYKAREILGELLVGNLRRVPGDPPNVKMLGSSSKRISTGPSDNSCAVRSSGSALYWIIPLGGLLTYSAYKHFVSQ